MKHRKRGTPPAERAAVLNARRALKMAGSAHAYVRGSTLKFYEWLVGGGRRTIPKGPPVWICGDCHAGNLGPLADAEGHVSIQIRDLDQTVIGNPNHDLIRLALSLASAARGSNLPGVTTARMLEHMVAGYLDALNKPHADEAAERPNSVRVVMRRAMSRTWKHLARERLKDIKPKIPRGERFWPLTAEEDRAILALCDQKAVKRMVRTFKDREDADIEVLDAAYWMKGCSSLGRLRYAILLAVRAKDRDDEYCLIDIKEATAAAAPRAARAPMPRDHGERVVEGARHLSPALGERMLSTRLLERPVVVRELMPQDLKLDIDRLSQAEAIASARYLAEVVGHAHARQMERGTRREFVRSLKARHSKRLDAPSWLWASVVELLILHEAAYLEHCRRFALQA